MAGMMPRHCSAARRSPGSLANGDDPQELFIPYAMLIGIHQPFCGGHVGAVRPAGSAIVENLLQQPEFVGKINTACRWFW